MPSARLILFWIVNNNCKQHLLSIAVIMEEGALSIVEVELSPACLPMRRNDSTLDAGSAKGAAAER